MRLDTVNSHEDQGRDEELQRCKPCRGVNQGEWNPNQVGERVKQETGTGIQEIEMPRIRAPSGRLARDDIELECGEFGPQRKLLPEEGIDENGRSEANQKARYARRYNLTLNADAFGEEEE